jgi:protein AATF/BFR2
MVTLASQLAQLSDPKPKDFDPEDFERQNPGDSSDEENVKGGKPTEHYVTVGKSRLRDNSLKLDDPKYKGTKASASELLAGLESGSSEEGDSGSESGEDIDRKDSEDEDSGDEDSEEEGEEEEENGSVKPVAEDEETKRAELKKLMAEEQKKIVSRLSDTQRADAEKGEAVQHQMNIYEALLDGRINIQKAVTASNVLPIDTDVDESVVGEETPELQERAISGLVGLMDRLSQLRMRLMQSDNVVDDKFSLNSGKKRSLSTAFQDVEALEQPLNTYRDAILEKWSRKIQSSSGAAALQNSKFRSLHQTAAVQVNSVLADMDRLVKRTRTNRSNYRPLGQTEDNNNAVDAEENEHIFDDTDFYRLQLKDLVDRRMADSTNTDVAGVKWAVSKAKVKKNVDTKASKGRKLRYQVQEKIQGFDAPRPNAYPWPDEKTDELFSSLFGGKFRIDESEDDNDDEEEQSDPEVEIAGDFKLFG